MDATRTRRTRDCARQRWYAFWRSLRFARSQLSPAWATNTDDAIRRGHFCRLALRALVLTGFPQDREECRAATMIGVAGPPVFAGALNIHRS